MGAVWKLANKYQFFFTRLLNIDH